MSENASRPPRAPFRLRHAWPWLVLLLAIIPAVWHVVDFPDDVDGEVPGVERPTFNRFPPAAYRLAEPGDTIDRVAIYASAAIAVLSAIGLARSRGGVGLWPASLAIGLACLWHAATPGPTFDNWHGLGWRVVADGSVPGMTRAAIGLGAICLAATVAANLSSCRARLAMLWARAGELRVRNLFLAAAMLIAARQVDLPGVEPVGYWPRWAFVWGLMAFGLGCLRLVLAQGLPRPSIRLATTIGGGLAWVGLVVVAVHLSWFHRPLARLRAVEPGRIYISAMPTYRGLEVAHARHGFKTIINIFPEDTSQRSPLLPDEERFVREHGIRYIQALASDNDSDRFLDETLALARDPDAWPILLHCHGCMDRSPAWMGIYRFVVQGRSLGSILKEIEAHRGDRPKATITLLFARVLKERAPERFRDDPTAAMLERYAHGQKSYPRRPQEGPITSAGDGPRRQ